MRVLFFGGNGTISAAISRLLVERGHDLTLVSRGRAAAAPDARPPIEGATIVQADVDEATGIHSALGECDWDVVADFRAFRPQQVATAVEALEGRVGQYVFISSASAYQKPVERLPITESTPLRNPHWQYSRDKIACEDVLIEAYRERRFPMTIVRPSHTYDERLIPIPGDWTAIDRMRRGLPLPMIGDGTSLWTLTHSRDFAVAFAGLLGNARALGDTFQITSDEALTWERITRIIAAAAGAPEPELIPVTSEQWGSELPELRDGLVGDKAHSVVFDNAKVKSLVPEYTARVPYHEGAAEMVHWYDADASRRTVDPAVDAALDRLVARFGVR